MAVSGVVGLQFTGITSIAGGTTRSPSAQVVVRVANALPGLFILPKYNPSNNLPTPNPLNGHIFPVQPLPGGAGQAGPVGYPIDSG